MKSKVTQILYAYWNEVRQGRQAPRRFDIEPARIGSILPDTFILERIDQDTFNFRLAGTRITERFGDNLRASNVLAGWNPADRETFRRLLSDLCEKGSVELVRFEAESSAGPVAEYEMIMLPLVHTRGTIDRVLGSIACLSESAWGRREPHTLRKLVETEHIWPDGRPYAAVHQIDRQAPFLPQVRTARIVRQDRRQFRVYDGGLAKPGNEDI